MEEPTKKSEHNFWTYVLLYPLALILVFEEWGWVPLAAQFDKLTKIPQWKHLEERVVHLHPHGAMIILGIPFIALIPIKLFGLYLFDLGHLFAGFVVIITSKLFGTALFARLFQLTKPALLKLNWFARWYPRWKNWKDPLMQKVRESTPWKAVLIFKSKIKRIIYYVVHYR